MGKKASPPKSPNLQPLINSSIQLGQQEIDLAKQQFGLSQQQFDFLKQQAGTELAFARQQADRSYSLQDEALKGDAEMRAIASRVANSQANMMDQTAEYARRDRQRYESQFLPMQDQFVHEANNYDTAQRRDSAASQATVDVQRMADAQRQNADMQMRSMGIDPSQVRSGSMLNQMQVGMAAQQAASANNARQGVEDRGRAMRADALNLGMGLPTQAMQGFQTSSNAGGAASGAAGTGAQINAQRFANYNGLANSAVGMRGNALQAYGALTGTGLDWNNAGQSAMGMGGQFKQMAGNFQQQGFENNFNRWQAAQSQWQRWFDNAATTAQTVAQFMAEGGAVKSRRRYAAEGGGMVSGILSKIGKNDDHESTYAPSQTAAPGTPAPSATASTPPPAQAAPAQPAGGSFDNAQANMTGAFGAQVAPQVDSSGGTPPSFTDRLHQAWSDHVQPGASGGSKQATTPPAQIIPKQNAKPFDTVVFSPHPQVQFASEGAAMAGHGGPGGRGAMAVPRRQARDQIPAMLAEGEYVMPADVVDAKGLEFFDRLVAKYHRPGA